MTSDERSEGNCIILDKIKNHNWYIRADIILAFVSYGSEIDTHEIILDAFKRGKNVYVPKVVGNDMFFYRIDSLNDLRSGYKGIREPEENEEFIYDAANVAATLMIMPGVAFDKNRNRIGYGKGFYDRYLSDKKELANRTIAIGYKCQMVDNISSDVNDIKPAEIICV